MGKKSSNTIYWVGAAAIAVYLYYTWSNGTGFFVPGGLLANVIPPPSTTPNATALPTTQTAAAPNLTTPSPVTTAGQVLVPVTTVTPGVSGINGRAISSLL